MAGRRNEHDRKTPSAWTRQDLRAERVKAMRGKVRRTSGMTASELKIGGTDRVGVPRFLAYALPGAKDNGQTVIHELNGFDLHDSPRGAPESFLDFDGVVVFVGCFERIPICTFHISEKPKIECDMVDLDRRERQLYTLIQNGRPFVFLMRPIPDQLAIYDLDKRTDLFRRFMSVFPIDWNLLKTSVPFLDSRIEEFRSFIEKYGAARVAFHPSRKNCDGATIIVGDERQFFGFEIRRLVFFLPCHSPNSHQEGVEMVADAIKAVIAYRERMSEEMPDWAAEFQFAKEKVLREAVDQNRAEIVQLEAELGEYATRKGALCYRSEPLVRVVIQILESVFGLRTESDEKYIEDARVIDDEGNTIAVLEIKGVNGSFTRQHVNQVDSHRERLKMPSATSGLLIMNTNMTAQSLAEKDQPPHPDIIGKAVQDNVLLVRTLDLLRYVDLVETGGISKDESRTTMLTKSGWLKVEGNVVEVVRQE